jgi:cell division septum initiation protein DivIVA
MAFNTPFNVSGARPILCRFMTKAQEINAIKEFTANLPKDSYLRPWLESSLPEIESDIRNDFPVSPAINLARVECNRMLEAEKRDCQVLRENAERQAANIVKQANQQADSIRNRLFTNLRGFIVDLGFSS